MDLLAAHGADLRRGTSDGTWFPAKYSAVRLFANSYELYREDGLDDGNLNVLHIAAISGLFPSMTYFPGQHQDLGINSKSA